MRLFSRIPIPTAPYFLVCLAVATYIGRQADDILFPALVCALIGVGLAIAFTCAAFQRSMVHMVAFLFFALGTIHSIMFFSLPDSPDHIRFQMPREKVVLTSRIDSFARHYAHRIRYQVELIALSSKTLGEKKVSGRILFTVYGPSSPFKFGDVIQFRSYLKPLRNFQNPGGFDYVTHMRMAGIYGTAYAGVDKIKLLSDAEGKSGYEKVLSRIEDLRNRLDHGILETASAPETAKRILSSIVTGKKENLTFQIRDLFSKSGISHVLAISGLHLSIIGFLSFPFFYLIFSFSSQMLVTGRAKKAALAATIIPITGYAMVAGFSNSIQRAYIMTIVFVISFIFEKEKDLVSSLCIATLVILLIDPTALFSISLQLSFAAVFFIILGIKLLQPYIRRIRKRFLKKPISLVAVTVFAGIGTLPLGAHYFHIISFVQLPANLFAVPLVGFVVLPIGILAALASLWLPSAAGFLIGVCCHCLSWIIGFAGRLTQLPMSWTWVSDFSSYQIFLYYLSCVILFFVFKKKHNKFTIMIFAMVLLAGIWDGFEVEKRITPGNAPTLLDITVLDVGQGNSALIQTPEKKNILIDGGGFPGVSQFDTGRFIVAPFLWHQHIRNIDYVIITHPEIDHLKGLVFIVENFRVGAVIKNSDENDSEAYRSFMDICRKKHIKIIYPDETNKRIRIGSTFFEFFGPFEMNLKNYNDNSIVTRIVYRDFKILFPGDILKKRESVLSQNSQASLKSDILIAPHHGSSTSSSKFFLDKVMPESVIISCGWHNRYGFPNKWVLKRYKGMGIRVLRTDTNGAVQVSSNGRHYQIKPFRGN